jgi:hypothetical protein
MSSKPGRSGRPPFPQGIGLEGKRYIVMYGLHVVGWTNLEVPMEDERSAAGVFEPGPQYHLVTGVFDVYRSTPPEDLDGLRAFVAMRDALGLTVYEESSLPLAAEVQLISEWGGGKKVIHATVADERYWVRFRTRGGRQWP